MLDQKQYISKLKNKYPHNKIELLDKFYGVKHIISHKIYVDEENFIIEKAEPRNLLRRKSLFPISRGYKLTNKEYKNRVKNIHNDKIWPIEDYKSYEEKILHENTYGEIWKIAPYNSITARELYRKTIRREQKLKRLGYVIISIWETDYNNNLRQELERAKSILRNKIDQKKKQDSQK